MTIIINIFLGWIFIFGIAHAADKVKVRPLLMPDVRPTMPNAYLCTAFKMPSSKSEYIVEFLPNASMDTSHHINIIGCKLPGLEVKRPHEVWDCGWTVDRHPGYPRKRPCSPGSQVLYTWSMNDAYTSTKLPEGVGFKVGKGTGINYLVLQVHYLHVEKFQNGTTDNSGVFVTTLPGYSRRINKTAGLYLLGTSNGTIKSHNEAKFETACLINEHVVIHPFSFNPHTHALGTMVSGFKIDKNGKWHLIGKHNPQEPQVFYPVEDPELTLGYGDVIAARCTYYNFREISTSIGESETDEMCNFYMMYWVDKGNPMKQKYCFSKGPGSYSWKSDPNIMSVPPEIDVLASQP